MPKSVVEKVKNYPSIQQYFFKGKKPRFIDEKIQTQLKNVTSIDTTCENVEKSTCAPATAPAIMTANAAVTQLPPITITKPIEAAPNYYDEFKMLEKKYKVCEQNLKTAKNLLRKSSDINLEKDLRIQQMLNENSKIISKSSVLFESHSNRFDACEMIEIRSIGPGVKKDSTFISKIMKFLYKNEPEKLSERSATGKKFKGIKKHEVTLEKKEILKNMLSERVKSELDDQYGSSNDLIKRVGRLNSLIRFALGNLVSKHKKDKGISTINPLPIPHHPIVNNTTYQTFQVNVLIF